MLILETRGRLILSRSFIYLHGWRKTVADLKGFIYSVHILNRSRSGKQINLETLCKQSHGESLAGLLFNHFGHAIEPHYVGMRFLV